MSEQGDTTQEFEEALRRLGQEKYVLRLFVAGMNPKSIQAIENIKRICEMYLAGRYQLEVIDVYQQPILAKDGQIVAAPTLIKELPPPLRRLVGSMADTERVLVGMDLHIGTAGTTDPTPEVKPQKSKEAGQHNGQV
jgi:circadian clock protein KaiB